MSDEGQGQGTVHHELAIITIHDQKIFYFFHKWSKSSTNQIWGCKDFGAVLNLIDNIFPTLFTSSNSYNGKNTVLEKKSCCNKSTRNKTYQYLIDLHLEQRVLAGAKHLAHTWSPLFEEDTRGIALPTAIASALKASSAANWASKLILSLFFVTSLHFPSKM